MQKLDSKKGQCNEHPEKKGSTEDDQFLALVRANRQQTGLTLRLDTVAPFSLTEAPFMYQRAAAPLFKLDMESKSNFCWFNPNLTFSPLSSRSSPSLLGLAASSSPKKDCPPSPSQGVAMDRTEALGRRFAQAGWLAVQAIANGVVLPLPLPATFFRFLLDPKKYRITEAEIQDLDPNTVRNINRVRSMAPAEFKGMLEYEELDPKLSKEDWIQQTLTDIFMSDTVKDAMEHFRSAFFSSGLRRSTIFPQLQPEDLQAIIVGRLDDGVADFDLEAEFRILPESDFTRFPHNEVFLKTIFEVIAQLGTGDNETPNLKRLLLKFITGRTILPARKGEEVIRFELPHTTLTSQVYDTIMERLPQAHTCNNTLELPNYCEGLLFSTTSWWYRNEKWQTEAADLDRTFVGSGDKEVLWSILPEDEKEKVLQELRARFRQKLVLAIENANGYDLDEMRPAPPSINPSSAMPPVRPTVRGSIVQLPTQQLHLYPVELPEPLAGPSKEQPNFVTVDELPTHGYSRTGP
jgi:hypothetical protein